ncbi:MAG TPA: hypothetical protein VMP86_06460, partial [Candidatus Binatia bacterium]|nr:hypothetical protein [Candidatus Binatia bacterium]
QATPDHTVSIMSSGTGFGGFGHMKRTATVASVTGVGRLFLRDISVPAGHSRAAGRTLSTAQRYVLQRQLQEDR